MSGFPFRKTFDMFDFSFQPSIDKAQIDELCTMRFVENGENVVFLGTPSPTPRLVAVKLLPHPPLRLVITMILPIEWYLPFLCSQFAEFLALMKHRLVSASKSALFLFEKRA